MKAIWRWFLTISVLGVSSACATNISSAESFESHVSKLVDQMTGSEKIAKKAVREIESLGRKAAPYLVSHLGDMRPLIIGEIGFENNASSSFEEIRYYSPKVVHDVLSAILNQVTKKFYSRLQWRYSTAASGKSKDVDRLVPF